MQNCFNFYLTSNLLKPAHLTYLYVVITHLMTCAPFPTCFTVIKPKNFVFLTNHISTVNF